MALLPIKGKHSHLIVIVDDDRLDGLLRYNWYGFPNNSGIYIRGYLRGGDTRKMIRLHRLVMNAPVGIDVDHKDHNTLNNTKDNLRFATDSQNHANEKPTKRGSSKYKGVSWHKQRKKWRAQIRCNTKCIHLGYFDKEIDAAHVYNQRARLLFGAYALLNFM